MFSVGAGTHHANRIICRDDEPSDGKPDETMTQAELRYAAQDAFDTMKLAMKDNRWADVTKYSMQLQEYVGRHRRDYGYAPTFSEHATIYS